MSRRYFSFVVFLTIYTGIEYHRGGAGDRVRKTETLNLRVSSEFKRRLVEEARKEKRSVTNYLEVILTNLWKQQKVSPKRSAEKTMGEGLRS